MLTQHASFGSDTTLRARDGDGIEGTAGSDDVEEEGEPLATAPDDFDEASNAANFEDQSEAAPRTPGGGEEGLDDLHGPGDNDEERSEASGALDDDEEDGKDSVAGEDAGASTGSPKGSSAAAAVDESKASVSPKKKKRGVPPHVRKGRAPAVKGLTIPFRTVKKVRQFHKH